MKNKRLYYRVTLKLLTTIAALILLVVFINSLFVSSTGTSNESKEQLTEFPIVIVELSSMTNDEIKKVRWNGKEILVLYRDNLSLSDKNYFVFENHGDSGHCPLFYGSNTFKDVCSGKLFNLNGREKNNTEQGYQLISPPYTIAGEKLLIGVKE